MKLYWSPAMQVMYKIVLVILLLLCIIINNPDLIRVEKLDHGFDNDIVKVVDFNHTILHFTEPKINKLMTQHDSAGLSMTQHDSA
jgi:hypothetical protein